MSEKSTIGSEILKPVRSSKYPRIKKLIPIVLFILLLLFPLLQIVFNGFNYWIHMMLYVFLYIIMASSWNMIGGYAGYISLGHNVFLGFGAYLSGMVFVYFRISPFLTAPLAGILAVVGGLLFGLIALRTRGTTFIISTIALVLLMTELLDNWKLTGGTNGLAMSLIQLKGQYAKIPYYYYLLVIMALTLVTSYLIRHSKFGLALRAISQDETKAEVAGIPTRLYKILAFGISGLFIGMAGAIWGSYLTYLRPSIFLPVSIGTTIVLMAILGGKGTIIGPAVGATVMIIVNEFVVAKLGASELNIVVTGLILIFVLLYFPEGIIGTLKAKNLLPSFLDWG
jgi:branched-chain amino acid transport system permease protein